MYHNEVFKRNKSNNNSLFCRCIFHEPQKAKWKGTIVHFSFNAQRSFETIMYYNITYLHIELKWKKIVQ